jgi:transcriptional regulator with XRE-family HTH domain
VYASPLHERLAAVVGQRSSRYVGELTNTNHETVRRYLSGQAPSTEFLQAVCRAFGLSADWLLLGKGPMKASDVRDHALRQADPSELLTALAVAVERLIERVDRLEQMIQMIEVRVRALSDEPRSASRVLAQNLSSVEPSGLATRASDSLAQEIRDGQTTPPVGSNARSAHAPVDHQPLDHASPQPASTDLIPERILRLRDALAKRPRPDAR